MAPNTADTSLRGARTSALRGAFLGLVRNTAMSPTDRQVLAQRTLDQTPLSPQESEYALALNSALLSKKFPDLPPAEIRAAAMEITPKLTRRDYQSLLSAVRAKASLDMAAAGVNRSMRSGGDPDAEELEAIDKAEAKIVDQLQTPFMNNPPNRTARVELEKQLAFWRKRRYDIVRRRSGGGGAPAAAGFGGGEPAPAPAAPSNRAAEHGF